MNIFVFDIETVPDTENGRKLYHLGDLNDHDTAAAMFALRREKVGHEFLPLHLQRIVAISVVFKKNTDLKVWSLGTADSSEKELIERFYHGIEKYTPTLVSWNGSGFDLPVLHYRSLLHGVTAHRYWEVGESDQSFRWNNYINRYHYRHTDIMDILAAYQARANAPLDEIATLLGLPGKMGMSGGHVWQQFLDGNIEQIRNYCETDVLNTYLVYLRLELIRGQIDQLQYQEECHQVKTVLERSDQTHLKEFLTHWQSQDMNSF